MQFSNVLCRSSQRGVVSAKRDKLTIAAVAAAHHARIGAADSIYIRGIDDGDDDTPEFT